MGYNWYISQLKQDYKDDLIMPDSGGDPYHYVHNIIIVNRDKQIYYSNDYTKDWQSFPLVPNGIVYKVMINPEQETEPNTGYFALYSYRGSLDEKIRLDEFTDFMILKNYSTEFRVFADILFNNKEYAKALEFYKKSYIFNNDYLPMEYIGSCYYYIGDMNNAEKYWNETLDLNPQSSFVYSSLAVIYLNTGEREKAIRYINNALKYDNNNGNALRLKEIIEKGQSIVQ